MNVFRFMNCFEYLSNIFFLSPKYVQAFRKPRPLAIREIYDVPYPTVYRAIVIETDDFCMEDTGELLRLTDCKKSKCSLQ